MITPYKSQTNSSAGRRLRKSRESRQSKRSIVVAEIKLNVKQTSRSRSRTRNEEEEGVPLNIDIDTNSEINMDLTGMPIGHESDINLTNKQNLDLGIEDDE